MQFRCRTLVVGTRLALCVLVGTGLAVALSTGSNAIAAPSTALALPSPGCRVASAVPAGEQTVSYDAAGEDGLYIEDVPPSQTEARPLPLVFDLHGYLEPASLQNEITGLGRFGDAHGFVTITPQVNFSVQHWDVAPNSADITYLGDLLGHVEHTTCVDQRRIFFAGYSNGAWMTSVIACDFSSRVAAVAPVAGLQDFSWCRSSRPVPVVAFHGTADPFVAYQGGSGQGALSLPALDDSGGMTGKTVGQELAADPGAKIIGPLPASIPDQVGGWARRNGCSSAPSQRRIAGDVTLFDYSCPTGANVEFYRITGGGHAWPGSTVSASLASAIGHTTFSIDADQIMWAFFEAHPLRN